MHSQYSRVYYPCVCLTSRHCLCLAFWTQTCPQGISIFPKQSYWFYMWFSPILTRFITPFLRIRHCSKDCKNYLCGGCYSSTPINVYLLDLYRKEYDESKAEPYSQKVVGTSKALRYWDLFSLYNWYCYIWILWIPSIYWTNKRGLSIVRNLLYFHRNHSRILSVCQCHRQGEAIKKQHADTIEPDAIEPEAIELEPIELPVLHENITVASK